MSSTRMPRSLAIMPATFGALSILRTLSSAKRSTKLSRRDGSGLSPFYSLTRLMSWLVVSRRWPRPVCSTAPFPVFSKAIRYTAISSRRSGLALLVPRNNRGEATAFWKSDAALDRPDLQSFMVEAPYASPQAAKVAPPANSWSLTTAVLRTASRGRLRLTGSDPLDPIDIDANALDDPADLQALKICVEFCRAIGNSVPLRRFAKREILPGRAPCLRPC